MLDRTVDLAGQAAPGTRPAGTGFQECPASGPRTRRRVSVSTAVGTDGSATRCTPGPMPNLGPQAGHHARGGFKIFAGQPFGESCAQYLLALGPPVSLTGVSPHPPARQLCAATRPSIGLPPAAVPDHEQPGRA